MLRRTFLTLLTSVSLAPTLAFGQDFVDYTPGLIETELAAGKTVFVAYAADWCTTCARQERIIETLRKSNPAYDEAMTFVTVDWDRFGRRDVATSRSIPRRSTLIVLRGDKELGRIVAGTREESVQNLMNRGL